MTAAAIDSGIFDRRDEPGLGRAAGLAAAVHILLVVLLVFGVNWQNRPPEVVSVELWEPPPPPTVEAPRVAPAPPPPLEAKPEPPVVKPQIVERAAPKAPPKPPPKVEPKPAPKAAPKAEPKAPPKPAPVAPPDDAVRRRMLDELAREQMNINAQRESNKIRDQLTQEANQAREKALATWVDKIRIKVRSNVIAPPDVKGNPEAEFEIVQLPTGEVISVKQRKSSGNRALDEAIERAILKSSPLPKPDRPELFQRTINLKYRPQDL